MFASLTDPGESQNRILAGRFVLMTYANVQLQQVPLYTWSEGWSNILYSCACPDG